MTWILIAWTLTWGVDAIGTVTSEFNSFEACQSAGQILESKPSGKRSTGLHYPWQFVCVSKGDSTVPQDGGASVLISWLVSRGDDAIGTVTVELATSEACEKAGEALHATVAIPKPLIGGNSAANLRGVWQYVCVSQGETPTTE